MSLTYPIIWWGSVADLSTWTQDGTCGASGSQTDPFSGTTAYSLNDGNGSLNGRYLEYTAAYSGYHIFAAAIRVAGDMVTSIQFANVTASSTAYVDLTWTSGVPVASGMGQHWQPVAIGGSYYIARLYVYAVAGHTMRVTLYPAGRTAANAGTSYWYVRNVCLLDYPDQVMAWEEPREGSSWAQSGSGEEDAWIQGTDYRLSMNLPWIPQTDRDTPASVSGWGLPLEAVGVNSGVSAMLRAGRNKETLSLYMDRTTLGIGTLVTKVDCVLVGPLNGAPTVQPNGDRSLTLELRNASKPFRPYELT